MGSNFIIMKNLASLPMYERPELNEAHNNLWTLIKYYLSEKKIDHPINLIKGKAGLKIWENKNLFLSQTCSLPFRKKLFKHVKYVGTPIYDIQDCPQGYYRSFFIVKKKNKALKISDFSDKIFAYNEINSQSGYAAAYNHLFPKKLWFKKLVYSGSHKKSVNMVFNEEADITCIDALTWNTICSFDEYSKDMIVIDKTIPTPGLPYITSQFSNISEELYFSIKFAFDNLNQRDITLLKLKGIIKLKVAKYLEV